MDDVQTREPVAIAGVGLVTGSAFVAQIAYHQHSLTAYLPLFFVTVTVYWIALRMVCPTVPAESARIIRSFGFIIMSLMVVSQATSTLSLWMRVLLVLTSLFVVLVTSVQLVRRHHDSAAVSVLFCIFSLLLLNHDLFFSIRPMLSEPTSW